MNNPYTLRVLPLFVDDLNEITDYIADTLKNPIAANKMIDDIESAIYKRLPMCKSFPKFPSLKEREHPYYYIIVKNYIVFYVVIDDVMEVRRIMYNRRNISEQI